MIDNKITIDKKNNEIILGLNGLEPREFDFDYRNRICQKIFEVCNNEPHVISFNAKGDCLPAYGIFMISDLLKDFTNKFPHLFISYKIYSAGVPTDKNLRLYEFHCKKYDLFPGEIIFNSQHEFFGGIWIRDDFDFFKQFDTNPRIKNKKFLSFNGSVRMHRFFLASQMIKHKLIDSSYFSMQFGRHNPNEIQNIFNELKDTQVKWFLPNLGQEVTEILDKNLHLFPINLNWKEDEIFPHHGVKGELYFYNDSYFSIVTETKFFRDIPEHYVDAQLDCYFMSEKIIKPIIAKHPFMIMSRPYFLEVLKEIGYKTFHPFINEEYDSIEDDEKRLQKIIEETLRLCNFTNEQWLEWQHNIKDIVEHNFNHLLKRSLEIRL